MHRSQSPLCDVIILFDWRIDYLRAFAYFDQLALFPHHARTHFVIIMILYSTSFETLFENSELEYCVWACDDALLFPAIFWHTLFR